MGVGLYVEVLKHAPRDLLDGEYILLLVIAEDARDETRLSWSGMDHLVAYSHKAESSVRRLLTSLEEKKLIRRLSARQVQPGARPVTAYRGKRQVIQLLPLAPDMPDTEALTHERHPDEKGAHPRAERRSPVSGKALSGEPPPLMSPQTPSAAGIGEDVIAAVRLALLERTGREVGPTWARMVATQLLAHRAGISSPARYVAAVLHREPDSSVARFLPTPGP